MERDKIDGVVYDKVVHAEEVIFMNCTFKEPVVLAHCSLVHCTLEKLGSFSTCEFNNCTFGQK